MQNHFAYPGWEIVGIIGRGSFGTVYEIKREQPNIPELAALKVISIPKEEDLEDLRLEGYGEESITKSFERQMQDVSKEYSLMQQLSGNTNIVNVHDVDVVQHYDGVGWDILIRMELLTPLTQLVKGKELPEAQIVKLGKDLCQALALCEKNSIIHRDIKPQNVFASTHGDYKLGDFGIAKISERTSSGTKAGTPRFMAPEVNNGAEYGHKADLYSLGLVMYWLLNDKRLPFMPKNGTPDDDNTARKRRLSGEKIPEPSHGSKGLKQIVCKACAFYPEDRFSDAQEMLEALETLKTSEEPIVIPHPEVNPLLANEFALFRNASNTSASANKASNGDIVEEGDTNGRVFRDTSSDEKTGTKTTRGRKVREEVEREKREAEERKRREEQEREREREEQKRKRLILFGSAGIVLLTIILLIAVITRMIPPKPAPTPAPVPVSSSTPVPVSTPESSYVWSEWSSWSTNAVESTATREVETREEQTLVGYYMVHYGTQKATDPHYRMFRNYSIEGNYDRYGARYSYQEKYLTKYVTVEQMRNATVYPPNSEELINLVYNGESYGGFQMGTTDAYNFGDDNKVWFIESEDYSVVTEYRHRDLVER